MAHTRLWFYSKKIEQLFSGSFYLNGKWIRCHPKFDNKDNLCLPLYFYLKRFLFSLFLAKLFREKRHQVLLYELTTFSFPKNNNLDLLLGKTTTEMLNTRLKLKYIKDKWSTINTVFYYLNSTSKYTVHRHIIYKDLKLCWNSIEMMDKNYSKTFMTFYAVVLIPWTQRSWSIKKNRYN